MTPPPLFQERDRADSFGEDAELYDRSRPTYPSALVDFLLADGAQRVLDVGCGTGIASRLFLARGAEVLGVEPDARMAGVARRHGLEVEVANFETWDSAERKFELVFAGQSWHWIDPNSGFEALAAVCVPGGRAALVWNVGMAGEPPRDDIAASYVRHGTLVERRGTLGAVEGVGDESADAFRKDGRFDDVEIRRFPHDARYTTTQWIDQLRTQSDHRTLEPTRREALLRDVAAAIEAHGGFVPTHYETVCVIARRSPR